MKRRLVILTEIISPYRTPLFNALARQPEVDLHVIFLAETDPSLRQWQVYKQEIRFSYEVLRSWRKRIGRYNSLLNFGLGRALNTAAPDAIVFGGYNYVASWQALFWARARGVPFFLWSESNLPDVRRGYALVEMLKDEFLRQCSGFAVAGRSAREYLRAHKVREDLIFSAPDAVDNDLFAAGAADSRRNALALRAELGLPGRYFLFVGRIVPEKGVFDLLAAYAKLDERRRQQIGLVYVGDGAFRRQLEERAASISPGMIRCAGFVQRNPLATYYALAEMLILPTYSDPWGLVVNEAMACGLPVLVSRVAGCAADLVMDNWNGFLISPGDVSAMSAAMGSIADNAQLCTSMGANSVQLISRYSPAAWALGISRAIESTGRTASD